MRKINFQNKIIRIIFVLAVALESASLFFDFSLAQVVSPVATNVPRKLDVSALILNNENKMIANGEYDIRFSLYSTDRTDGTQVEGTPLWQETKKISIYNGILNSYLGTTTPLPNINFSSGEYYVGIKIGEDSEMVPRKRIGAVPLALDSFSVGGATVGTAQGNILKLGAGGKVDISNLPTGTSGKKLLMAQDVPEGEIEISGSYSYIEASGMELVIKQVNLGTDVTGILPIARGGTGLSSYTAGDMIYYSAGSAMSKIGIGQQGEVLMVDGGAPKWGSATVHDVLTLAGAYDYITLNNQQIIRGVVDISAHTNLAIGGTMIQIVDDTISLKEGTLTTGKLCTFVEGTGLVCDTDSGSVGHIPATISDTASVDLSIAGQQISATVLPAGVDHNSLANLAISDVHTQYALLAGRAGGQILIGGTGTADSLVLQSTSATGIAGANIYFKVGDNGATTAMTILNSGNIGIGTTSPEYKLDINGTLGVGSTAYFASSIGIGTTNPATFKLEVAGDIGPEANNTRNLGSPDKYFNTAYITNLVTGSSGASGYWDRTGTVLSPVTDGDTLALYANGANTSGTLFSLSYNASATLTGDLIGAKIDLNDGFLIPTNQSVTGLRVVLPTTTNTNAAGTINMNGMSLGYGVGTGINQDGAGATVYSGVNLLLPALTQTTGTLTANGVLITTSSSITTGGIANGINIAATEVGAGSLRGVNISSITGSAGAETALNIGSGWDSSLSVGGTQVINGSGVVQVAAGGTGMTSYAAGDLIYASGTTTLDNLVAGTVNNGKILVVSNGLPTWGVLEGSSCTDCVLNDPTSVTTQTITPNNQDISSLVVRQTSLVGVKTKNIFEVTNFDGSDVFFYVDQNGNVSTGGVASQTLTLTPESDITALTLVGTNVPTASLQYINSKNTQGTISNIAYGTAATLAGALIGQKIDLGTNVTATDQSVTGMSLVLPAVTNTLSTSNYKGLSVGVLGGAGINQNGAGTTVFSGIDVTIPPLTQTAGSLTGNGVLINTPSAITTGGTANGLNIVATGVGAGILRGINVGDITAGAGAETGVYVGTGWDYSALFMGGNVGIGDSSPDAKLNIVGTSPLLIERTDGGYFIEAYWNANNPRLTYYATDGLELGYATAQSGGGFVPNMFLKKDGFVGIGTTAPNSKLEVAGTFTVSGSNLTTLGGNLTVTGTAWTATPTISGLITATSGLTSTGTLTANDILDANGTVYLGDGEDVVSISSNDWGISSTGNMTAIGSIDMNGQLTSIVSTGTAPFVIASTTLVTNLNSDLLDGQHGAYYATAASISGTDNYIPRFNGTSALENSIIYDNGTNVGIGTTVPGAKLDIDIGATSADPYNAFRIMRGTADLFTATYSAGDIILTGALNNDFIFKTQANSDSEGFKFQDSSGNDRVFISNNGNVGIGTTSPGTIFELQASLIGVRPTSAIVTINANSAAENGTGGYDNLILSNRGVLNTPNIQGSSISFKASGYTNNTYSTGRILSYFDVSEGASVGYSKAILALQYPTADNVFATGMVLQNGNVGIGTTSPTSILQVTQSGSSFNFSEAGGALYLKTTAGLFLGPSANASLRFQTNNTERMRIDNTGNVGIGTTAPLAVDGGSGTKLHIDNGTDTGAIEVARFEGGSDADNTYGVVRIGHANDRGLVLKGGRQVGDVAIGSINLSNSGGTDYTGLTLLQSGTAVNVGVGYADPGTAKLAINGNVGIGTTNPSSYTLQVVGTGGFSTSVSSPIFRGQSAAVTFGDVSYVTTVTGSGLTIVPTAWTATPTISGLITATNGLTSTGTLTANGTFDANGPLSLGDGGDTIFVNSTSWDVSTAGAISGVTTMSMSGQLTSTLATGTAPLVVASTTLVSNFNADLLDGQHGTYYATAASIAGTDNYIPRFNGTSALENSIIYDTGTSVGIGTTNPGANLELYASGVNLKITDSSATGSPKLSFYQSTTQRAFLQYEDTLDILAIDSDGPIRLNTNNTSAVYIDSSGNVGIGTTGPLAKLHIYEGDDGLAVTGGSTKMILEDDTAAWLGFQTPNSTYKGFFFNEGTDGDGAQLRYLYDGTATNSRYEFRGNAAEWMRIQNGNVGIGTTSPSQKLDVLGNIIAKGTSGYSGIYFNGDTTGSARYGSIMKNYDSPYDLSLNASLTAGEAPIIFNLSSDYEAMRILSSGNVGIGTTNPTFKLYVSGGDIYTSGDMRIAGDDIFMATNTANYFLMADGTNYNPTSPASVITALGLGSGGTYDIFVDEAGDTMTGALNFSGVVSDITTPGAEHLALMPGGNVGIGTTNPGAKLEISSAGKTQLRIADSTAFSAGVGGAILFAGKYRTAGDIGNFGKIALEKTNAIDSDYSFNLAFYTTNNDGTNPSATPQLLINNNGNVGIGTTNPQYELSFGSTNDQIGYYSDATHYANIELYDSSSGAMIFNHYHSAAGGYDFQWGGASKMYIQTDGNVGIGTTTPGYKLDVSGGSIRTSNQLISTVGLGTAPLDVTSPTLVSNLNADFLDNRHSSDFVLVSSISGTDNYIPRFNGTSALENSIIYDNGTSIGIGTTAPSYLLHIAGTAGITGVVTLTGVADGTDNTVLVLNASNQIVRDEIDPRVWGSTLVDAAGTANYVAKFSDANTLTESLIYDNGTSVGIGTVVPSSTAMLEVEHDWASDTFVFGQVIDVSNTATASAARAIEGLAVFSDSIMSGTASNNYGVYSLARNDNTSVGAPANVLASFYASVEAAGTGAVSEARGFYSTITETGTGPITTGYSFYSNCNDAATCYGLYVAGGDAGVTTDWGIYTIGEDKNYFSGNVGIGTTAPSQKLEVNGRIRMNTWTADGDAAAYQDTTTNSIALATSDRRLKKNITPLEGALDIITQLNGYMYNELDEADGTKKRLGLMSQEVLPLIPELTFSFTREGSSEKYYGVHYDKLTALLLEGIKEQQGMISGLDLQSADLIDQTYVLDARADDITLALNDAKKIDAELSEELSSLSESSIYNGEKTALIDSNLSQISANQAATEAEIAEQGTKVAELENQLAILEEKYRTIIAFTDVLEVDRLVYKDELGNIQLPGASLEADGVVAGAFTVRTTTGSGRDTIGRGTIHIYSDENLDGIDDAYPGNDGKSVRVDTKAVTATAKIFVTPQGDAGGTVWVEKIYDPEKEEYSGFWIRCSEKVETEDVDVDWWIVESLEN